MYYLPNSGLKKKLHAAGEKKDCVLIHRWTKSITNHLYWCASSTPDGNGEVMVAKFQSSTNHILNIHEHNNYLFPKCLHDPINDDSDQQDCMDIAWLVVLFHFISSSSSYFLPLIACG